MNPRERILAAMRRQETDYLPCAPAFWGSPQVPGYRWEDERGRLEILLNKLGVDAFLFAGISSARHPDVKTKVWEERPDDQLYPVLHKAIETPKGLLEAAVRKTEDWPYGEDIPLCSDFNVSRYVKPWLETMDDVERFAFLRLPPGKEEIRLFGESMERLNPMIEEYQVPVVATYAMGLTSGLQLFGAQQIALLSMDHPEIIDRFLEIQHEAEMKVLEILLDSRKVDVVSRNGFYESTDFWSPQQFEKWVLPQFQKEAEMAHQADRLVWYTMCTGIMPLLPLLKQVAFDCLGSVEPVLGNQDMASIKQALSDRCFWTGLSSPEHVGRGTTEDVRQAVKKSVSVFGKRGFILTAVPSIRPQWPWENVMAMIDEWKMLR